LNARHTMRLCTWQAQLTEQLNLVTEQLNLVTEQLNLVTEQLNLVTIEF